MDLIEFWAAWWWLVVAIWGLTWVVLGYGIGVRQGRGALGVILGAIVGPLGPAIVFTLEQLDHQEATRRAAALREAEEMERRLPPPPTRRSP